MQIKWRHNQITKLKRTQLKLSLTWQFNHDGRNLCRHPPPRAVGKFQVITPKKSTNEESSGYKHKEPYPN